MVGRQLPRWPGLSCCCLLPGLDCSYQFLIRNLLCCDTQLFLQHTHLAVMQPSRMFSIINLSQLRVLSQVGYLETVTSFVPVNNSIYCQKLGFKFLCTQNQLLTSQDKLSVCKKLKFKWRHQVIMIAIRVQCVSYILCWSRNVNLWSNSSQYKVWYYSTWF